MAIGIARVIPSPSLAKRVPKSNRVACATLAEQTAKAFARQAGVTFVAGNCKSDLWGRADIAVFYASAEAKPIVQSPEWAVHRSLSACQAALPSEEKFFSGSTGLTVAYRYCSYAGHTSSWETTQIPLYSPSFVAFGAPTKRVHSVSLEMHDGGFYGGSAVAEAVVEQSKKAGFPIVQAWVDASSNQKGYEAFLRMRFVSSEEDARHFERKYLLKDRVELFWASLPWEMDQEPMESGTVAGCEAQKKKAEALFASHFSVPVVWFCMWNHSLFKATLYHLRIGPGEESFERLTPGKDNEPFANAYASQAACEKDKARVEAHYQTLYPEEVVGTLCSEVPRGAPGKPSRIYVYLKN